MNHPLRSLIRRAGPKDASPRIGSRRISEEARPEGGGLEGFETPEAHAINRARLEHLDSLGLPLAGKRVLDVGGGPGHLAQYFVQRGCAVLSTDARVENVERLRELYPSLDAQVLDVEIDPIEPLGQFDVVFCYGLLYHLEDPVRALRKLSDAAGELLLLETMVCDSPLAVLRLEDEYLSLNQALRGIAQRPSPAWVATVLDRIGLHHVYAAAEPPEHPDYHFALQGNLDTARDGHLLRSIFVASRTPLENDRLIPLVEQQA